MAVVVLLIVRRVLAIAVAAVLSLLLAIYICFSAVLLTYTRTQIMATHSLILAGLSIQAAILSPITQSTRREPEAKVLLAERDINTASTLADRHTDD